MSWVKLDDKRAMNGKLRRAGLAARGLDEAAICWVAHQEDDGLISVDDVEMLATTHGCRKPGPIIKALVAVGRWEEVTDLDGRVTAYSIKDFLEYNPSRAQLEAQRKQKQEAGRKGGVRSGLTRSGSSTSEAGAST